MSVIGAMVSNPNRAFEFITENGVSSEWFNERINRELFDHLCRMRADNKPVDILTVNEGFIKDGVPVEYVEGCVDACPVFEFMQHYIEELETEWKKRKLATGLDVLSRIANESSPDEVVASVHNLLDSIHQRQHIKSESLYDIGSRIIENWENPEHVLGVQPRWLGLERLIGRYPNGGLIYLSGRPSQGKTTTATNQAAYNITHDIPTAFATLEMTRDRIVKRMIAEMSGVATFSIDLGGREFLPKIKETVEDFKKLPLYIADWGMSVDQLAAWAYAEKRRHGIKMLIVDRIELLRGPKGIRESDLVAKTSANSTFLQQLAKDLGIPVVVLTQLNRSCEIENREPEMFDLRQSGSLEQDATIVIMIYRDLKNQETTWIKVAKSQDTRVGKIPMKFVLDINRLVEDMDYYKYVQVSSKDFKGNGKYKPLVQKTLGSIGQNP